MVFHEEASQTMAGTEAGTCLEQSQGGQGHRRDIPSGYGRELSLPCMDSLIKQQRAALPLQKYRIRQWSLSPIPAQHDHLTVVISRLVVQKSKDPGDASRRALRRQCPGSTPSALLPPASNNCRRQLAILRLDTSERDFIACLQSSKQNFRL